ncbi:hypothetical protein C4Z92_16090 [Clostridioides difficile]|uniref:Uncharacterized protein n=1 Tax=Clostridioides difficile (strain 630) TaxID=272563 RepID=F3Y5Y9_CLOD6|nr:hypothetical protein CWR57_05680 [Clostridioides difficile]EQF60403.1 hypothetical protein QG7_1234 [Clostridioides difficile CD175]CCA62820.1 conserved hypothetical protein [Clostridioides difficile 630]CCL05282.1 Conserved hypothetical protein [Clostridioides difficile E13]CCL64073.1 Conserved hypothetical protein [Clostridioides difficile E7]CCL71693.1 Conserved hypothetical protein [Clostridioides difficile E28]CCL85546.1 Conserved hypothetical protein [Clostridioides difficile T19]
MFFKVNKSLLYGNDLNIIKYRNGDFFMNNLRKQLIKEII